MLPICPLHKLRLVPDGFRCVVRGFFHAPNYATASKTRFPQANALRIGSCAGRLRERPVGPYCPLCREELQAWCQEEIESGGDSQLLAESLLKELFAEGAE